MWRFVFGAMLEGALAFVLFCSVDAFMGQGFWAMPVHNLSLALLYLAFFIPLRGTLFDRRDV